MATTHSIKLMMVAALTSGAFMFANPSAQAAEDYYFFVTNKTDSPIVKLQVSEDKKTWGNFDVGKGIAAGEKAKLTWASSTNDSGCKQWIRAKFADGSTSEPSKQDFCENLDDPIEFE
jgi:hypothetical protein